MSNQSNLKRPRFLESDRLFLTPFSIDDLEPNFIWDNDAEMAFLDGGSFRPKTYAKAKQEFETALTNEAMMFFAIILKDSGENIGNIVLYNILEYHRRANWGIKLAPTHWRQGYGTEAARLLIWYAFEQLGLNRLKSDTHEKNLPSQSFQESLGFVKEGIFRQERYVRGEYIDDICYGLTRDDYVRWYESK
jgi:RimJ/RimL family protein N-acetyltransferase